MGKIDFVDNRQAIENADWRLRRTLEGGDCEIVARDLSGERTTLYNITGRMHFLGENIVVCPGAYILSVRPNTNIDAGAKWGYDHLNAELARLPKDRRWVA